MRKAITENIKRKLYAESMGRCMNPNCETELFLTNDDMAEKAHIVPHCKTADDSFENLILLCPNCHTNFDKNLAFKASEVKTWKSKRQEKLSKLFAKQFKSLPELEEAVKPILEENKTIYENYYLRDNKKLWDKFEGKVLSNNKKLKTILERNKSLFQDSEHKEYSNLEIINQFLLHLDEFNETRGDQEKIRSVLFPSEINSIFGLKPVSEKMLPSLESLECLIKKLQENDKFIGIRLGVKYPVLLYKEENKENELFLKDTPRLRQMYFEYKCFRKQNVRLDSLNYALEYLFNNSIKFEISNFQNLSSIAIQGKLFKFIYTYCLSKAELISLSPQQDLSIVNLHNWNRDGCISQEAYDMAEIIGVNLLTMNAFYKYVHKLK